MSFLTSAKNISPRANPKNVNLHAPLFVCPTLEERGRDLHLALFHFYTLINLRSCQAQVHYLVEFQGLFVDVQHAR